MQKTPPHPIQPDGIDADLIRQHLERINLSETFENVEEQRALLQFLIGQRLAGRQAQFTQSEIVDARIVSRSSSPRNQLLLFPDTQAVRTHIGRLRRTLALYYKHEGRGEQFQIDIPKRKYIATFSISLPPPLPPKEMVISEVSAGAEHQSAETLSKDAVRLYRQGQYAQAEPILKRALAIREELLGPEHPDTATSLNNLAMLYEKQGRYKEAVPMLEQALAICEKAFGPEHPDTVIGLNNLAIGYLSQARYHEALIIFERALKTREQLLGAEHSDTASSLNNLAMVYEKLARYKEALPILQRSLAIREKVLGPEHPDTAMSMNNLATVYRKEARFAEAMPLYQRAIEICERVLGPEHPDTITVHHNYIDLVEVYRPSPTHTP